MGNCDIRRRAEKPRRRCRRRPRRGSIHRDLKPEEIAPVGRLRPRFRSCRRAGSAPWRRPRRGLPLLRKATAPGPAAYGRVTWHHLRAAGSRSWV